VWVVWLSLVSIAVWAGFFGPIQVLLAQQAEAVDAAHKETVLALVTGLGAAVSTVLNPVWGAFSDRTVLRVGRRLPWVLGGLVVGVVAMVVLSQATTVPAMCVGWCLAQGGLNAMLAAVTAAVPDQVPVPQRGTVGGWLAIPDPRRGPRLRDRDGDRQHRRRVPDHRRAARRPLAAVLPRLPGHGAGARGPPAVRRGALRALVLGEPTPAPGLQLGLDHAVPDEPCQRAPAALPPVLPAGRGRPQPEGSRGRGLPADPAVRRAHRRHRAPRRDLVRPAGPAQGLRDGVRVRDRGRPGYPTLYVLAALAAVLGSFLVRRIVGVP
jgi:hypothetical protein